MHIHAGSDQARPGLLDDVGHVGVDRVVTFDLPGLERLDCGRASQFDDLEIFFR